MRGDEVRFTVVEDTDKEPHVLTKSQQADLDRGAHQAGPARRPTHLLTHPQPARVLMVAGLIAVFAAKSKSSMVLGRGKPASATRRAARRSSRSSHSASSSSDRNAR